MTTTETKGVHWAAEDPPEGKAGDLELWVRLAELEQEAKPRAIRRYAVPAVRWAPGLLVTNEDRVVVIQFKAPLAAPDVSPALEREEPAERGPSREEQLADLARWTLEDVSLDWEHAERVGDLAWGDTDH